MSKRIPIGPLIAHIREHASRSSYADGLGLDEVLALADEVERKQALLARLEWAAGTAEDRRCYGCWWAESTGRHDPACWLAKELHP